jgi:hypothetical protein
MTNGSDVEGREAEESNRQASYSSDMTEFTAAQVGSIVNTTRQEGDDIIMAARG